MDVTVSLPIIIKVDDYHEFYVLESYFKKLNGKIKVMEAGFNGKYLGIVYVKKDSEYKAIKKKADALSQEFERNEMAEDEYFCRRQE